VLTHPYLLSAFAYHNNTSPIHRGVFLTRNIVGRGLRPPPIAVAFKDDEFDPGLSMREKITQLTSDKACMSCHSVINPLGFALENFDAVGRWRTEENDLPVQSEGEYVAEDGTRIEVANALDIARFAVNSESAHRAFVSQLFHHMIKQDPAAYGTDTISQLQTAFAQNDFSIQNLMIEIATTSAMHGVDATLEITK
jgi:EAL domain-containing protein (putative c-di-GMP-specific phosphodiesterase class I)